MRILFILAFLGLSGFLFAQNAPTKEDTRQWLLMKFRLYNHSSVSYESGASANVFEDFAFEVQKDNTIGVKSLINYAGNTLQSEAISNTRFSLDNICSVVTNDKNFITLYFRSPISVSISVTRKLNDVEKKSEETKDYSFLKLLIDFDGKPNNDENINNRIVKALTSMAAYNCPKTKEVY